RRPGHDKVCLVLCSVCFPSPAGLPTKDLRRHRLQTEAKAIRPATLAAMRTGGLPSGPERLASQKPRLLEGLPESPSRLCPAQSHPVLSPMAAIEAPFAKKNRSSGSVRKDYGTLADLPLCKTSSFDSSPHLGLHGPACGRSSPMRRSPSFWSETRPS